MEYSLPTCRTQLPRWYPFYAFGGHRAHLNTTNQVVALSPLCAAGVDSRTQWAARIDSHLGTVDRCARLADKAGGGGNVGAPARGVQLLKQLRWVALHHGRATGTCESRVEGST